MKCLLMVNQLNDPFYIDYDESFRAYIIKRAKDNGLLEDDSNISKLDSNLVMQLFSPLILSQWLLIDQTREPCSSIHCPDGFCMVFKHIDDLLVLTINGDRTETEVFLHRKIQVFIRLIRFMFGPISEEVGQSNLVNKRAKWNFVRLLMNNWSELVNTEQSFAFEAIERLHVNQMVREKCVEVLEQAVKQLYAVRDIQAQHALLLVNSKLLALYSNRSAGELQPKDILAVMTLTRTLYPYTDRLEDLFSRQYVAAGQSRSDSLSLEEDDSGEGPEEEFHSAPTTPGGNGSRPSSTSIEVDQMNQREDTVSSLSVTDCPGDSLAQCSESDTIHNALSSDQNSPTLSSSCEQNMSLLQMFEEKYPHEKTSAIVSGSTGTKAENKESDKDDGKCAKEVDTVTSECSKDAITHNLQAEQIKDDNPMYPGEIKEDSLHEIKDSSKPRSNSEDKPNIQTPDSRPVTPHNKPGQGSHFLTKADHIDRDKLQSTNTSPDESCGPTSVSQVSERQSVSEGLGSQTSTPSSGPDQPSRSSSVLSGATKTYPELSVAGDPDPSSSPGLAVGQPARPTNGKVKSKSAGSRQPLTSGTPSPMNSSVYQTATSEPGLESYIPQTVFLESPTCLYSPYHLHSAHVLPGVTLVLLSQAPRRSLADLLYQVSHNLQDLLYGRRSKLSRSRGLHVYEIINSLLGRLHSSLKKFKGRIRSLSRDIHSAWEKEDLKHRLLDYLEKDARTPIPPELEAPMVDLYKKLKEVFSCLFLSPVSESPQLWEVLSQLRVHINAELLDYREYLNVKAQRNITMTSYIDEFPGLIHFVFIDRHFHQMTAPSLNISTQEGQGGDATSFLKAKIWSQYQRVMYQLMNGYTTVMLRDGDFYYSYFLWFEDYSGNPVQVQESFMPSRKLPYPGILSGSFYRELVQHCFPQAIHGSIHSYELFLVHLSSVHPQYVASHAKRLAHKMWEMNGEAFTSLSLF